MREFQIKLAIKAIVDGRREKLELDTTNIHPVVVETVKDLCEKEGIHCITIRKNTLWISKNTDALQNQIFQ